MSKAAPLTNLRPIAGTPWARDWRGDLAECSRSRCRSLATWLGDLAVGDRYTTEKRHTRHIRLCGEHKRAVEGGS